MEIPLEDVLAVLPEERRAAIETRAAELIAEEMSLQDLRRARALTQAHLAALLGIRQDSVSRIEKRSDLLLSTLRSYIEAMGGNLDIMVRFPDRPAVKVTSFAATATSETPSVEPRSPA